MTALELILAAATCWFFSHTVSREIPLTSQAPKPFSCQLCMSAWTVITAFWLTAFLAVSDPTGSRAALHLLEAGAIAAGSVFLEAAYTRLQTIII